MSSYFYRFVLLIFAVNIIYSQNDNNNSNELEKCYYQEAEEEIKEWIIIQSLLTENRYDEVENFLSDNNYFLQDDQSYFKISEKYISQDNSQMWLNIAKTLRIETGAASKFKDEDYADNLTIIELILVNDCFNNISDLKEYITEMIYNKMNLGFPFNMFTSYKLSMERSRNVIEGKFIINEIDKYNFEIINKEKNESIRFNASNFYMLPDEMQPEDKSITKILYRGLGLNSGLMFNLVEKENETNQMGKLQIIIASWRNNKELSNRKKFNLRMFDAIPGLNDIIWDDN